MKSSDKFLDKIIISILLFTIFFIITNLVIYCFIHNIPEVLVQCYFNAAFGELGIMGMITGLKTFFNARKEEE